MEVKVKYIAKDGREFDDPFECEKYEEMLSEKYGTIGYVLKTLKTLYNHSDTRVIIGTDPPIIQIEMGTESLITFSVPNDYCERVLIRTRGTHERD